MATILDLGPAHDVSAPPESAGAIRLSLLDGFALTIGGTPDEVSPAAQRLLAFLAIQERPVLLEYVSACLWADEDQEIAQASMRAELDRLRRPDLTPVRATASHLGLDPAVTTDLRDAIDGARTLLDPRSQVTDGDFGEFLMSGEVLPGWDEDWVQVERERLRQLRLHALEALCGRLTTAGRLAEAIDVGLAAVAADPLRESAHRVLIQAYLAEGNRVEAVRQCEAYRELLWNGLGVRPSPRLHALKADGLAELPRNGSGDTARPKRRKPSPRRGSPGSAYPDAGERRPSADEEEAR